MFIAAILRGRKGLSAVNGFQDNLMRRACHVIHLLPAVLSSRVLKNPVWGENGRVYSFGI